MKSILRCLKILGLFLFLTGLVSATPLVSNGDFSAGLTGWTVSGGGSTVTAASQGFSGAGNAALLSNQPTLVDQATAESTFFLAGGALTVFGQAPIFTGNAGITRGNTLYQDIITGLAGDQLTFDTRWLGGDSNFDTAVAVLGDPLNAASGQIVSIRPNGSGAGAVQNFSFTLQRDASAANPLRFGLFSSNTSDTAVSSQVALANIGGSSSAPKAPELNSTFIPRPFCVALIMLALVTSRRKETGESATVVWRMA
ncbi:MAG: hypothetical protein U0931_29530 [Vulcanimicrobiota bacterium]